MTFIDYKCIHYKCKVLKKALKGNESYLEDFFFVEKAKGYSICTTGYENSAMLFDNPFSANDVIEKIKNSFEPKTFRIAKFY